jgi:hypothetical protein
MDGVKFLETNVVVAVVIVKVFGFGDWHVQLVMLSIM